MVVYDKCASYVRTWSKACNVGNKHNPDCGNLWYVGLGCNASVTLVGGYLEKLRSD